MWALNRKLWLLLYVILYRSEREWKKEWEGIMQAGHCEEKGKKGGHGTEIGSGSDWHFIVNKIFIKEFYSKRGFYEWNFIVTCQAVQANSIWRLGFWSESLENSLIDGIVQRLCISVVKTFGTGFDNCESIFWALVESGQGFVEVVDTDYSGAWLSASDFSWSDQSELFRIISPIGQSN